EQGIQSLCCVPLITRKGEVGTLNLASRQKDAFKSQDLDILQQVAAQVAIALDNARAYREIADLTDKLAKEKLYLEDEIRTELHFEEIVGESAPLKRVLAQAKTVAPSDATTLILGETGTGKELIARDFRSDLYYRLNVFPIRMPPLRDRRDDIPLLVRYFVQKFARKMNKQVDTIPSETMNSLVGWEWPGNVRELENFMERSVILSD